MNINEPDSLAIVKLISGQPGTAVTEVVIDNNRQNGTVRAVGIMRTLVSRS